MELRIVFMGSPEFSLPTLQMLDDRYQVAGVVTQPDRRSGRGRQMTPPPVKVLAESLGLPVIQPGKLRDPEAMKTLTDWAPDLIVVAAFGQILRAEVLELPRFGCINVHASLLPRWRGASPVHHAILHGDEETGITIMKMDVGLDTGPVLSRQALAIGADETTVSLSTRLSVLGAALLENTLPGYLEGAIVPEPQDDSASTYAPMLKKQDGELDFRRPAAELARQVRAFTPWPGAYFDSPRGLLKVHRARPAPGRLDPSERSVLDGLPIIGTAQGVLVLEVVQPAGKGRMSGEVFLRGTPSWAA